MSAASDNCLRRVESRIAQLPADAQHRAETLAQVIIEFSKSHEAIGHVALNLATARMAAEVL